MPASNQKRDGILSATKLHHNPLFACTPADVLDTMELDYSSDECKENVFSAEKTPLSSSRVSSKRVLGERNECKDGAEPPKTIRALSYPYDISTYNSSSVVSSSYLGDETSPLSESEVSTPRFTLPSPLKTPESSDGSSDGAMYDPKENLRTRRPKFLRYRPDWRLQLMSSLELEPAAEGSPDLETEDEVQLGDIGHTDEVETKLNPDCDQAVEHEALKEELVVQEEVEEQIAAEQDNPKKTGLGFVLKAFALATIVALAVFASSRNNVSNARNFIAKSQVVVGAMVAFRNYLPEWPNLEFQEQPLYEWDWVGDYDTSEYYLDNLALLTVDSPDFAALLNATLFGTDQEIEDYYMKFTEFDEFGYDSFLEDLYELEEAKTPLEETVDTVVEQQVYTAEEHRGNMDVSIREEKLLSSSESDVVSDDTSAVEQRSQFHSPVVESKLVEEEVEAVDFKLPSTFEVAVLSSIVFAFHAFNTLGNRLKRNAISKRNGPAARERQCMSPTSEKPKVLKDLLEDQSDPSRESPYGNFTAYIVAKEGTNMDQVTLTPVRRSSRIRAQSPGLAAKRVLPS